MALIYRNVTGPISGPDGDPLATGTLRVKLRAPLVDGTTFVSVETIEETITDGAVTVSLAATGRYEFTVINTTGDTLWSFQATLGDSSGADISLAELFVQEETQENPDTIEFYTTFLALLDTPETYVGKAGLPAVVNSAEDALEFGPLSNVSSLQFALGEGVEILGEGHIGWNDTDKCLNMGTTGGSVAQIPLETWARVHNNTGDTIPNGAVVTLTGASGEWPYAGLADATDRASARSTVGIATQDIADDAEGVVTTYGLVRGVNTAAWIPGTPLFLHATNPGEMQAFASPAAPTSVVFIGIVLAQDATDGAIFVNLVVQPTLTELVDVDVDAPDTGEILVYNAATNVFENKVPSYTHSTTMSTYMGRAIRGKVLNQFGGLSTAITGGSVSNGAPQAFNMGRGKVAIAINAGTDFDGTLTITGTTYDPETGALTPGDTEDIVIDALTVDSSDTDAEGNDRFGFTGIYISSKTFVDGCSLSTTDTDISDLDIYSILFELFSGVEDTVVDAVSVTCTSVDDAAWFYGYMYGVFNTSGRKYDITRAISFEQAVGTVDADVYYNFSRDNLGVAVNGLTDGGWMSLHFGPFNATYWEDINVRVVAELTKPLTLS